MKLKKNYRKKILIVTNNLYGGGAEKVLETLVNQLDKNRYDITIYTLHKIMLKPGTYQNVKIKSFYKRNKIYNKIFMFFYEKYPKMFYRYFIRKKYDVEIAFIEGYATKIVANSSNKESKKLAWVHVDLINTPWTKVAFESFDEEKKCYTRFNKILCVSNGVKNAFIKKYNINSNVFVQYNPIDEKKILNLSKCNGSIKKHKRLQLITIGRLEYQKGYDRLLQVINRLKDYDFNLWILGTGSQKNELLKFIKDNKLTKYVTLLGYKENPYVYLDNADAFICSSRSEGFSTVVIESLILSKPVFTTDCAGMTEIFGEYKCGIICSNTEKGLLEMLKKVVANPDNLHIYKSEIIYRKKDFNLSSRIKEIVNIIEQ